MPATPDPLVLDLVQWVAREPRSYAEVIEAWRTSCPRLTIWEDAVEQGLLERRGDGRGEVVATTAGRAWLHRHGRESPSPMGEDGREAAG